MRPGRWSRRSSWAQAPRLPAGAARVPPAPHLAAAEPDRRRPLSDRLGLGPHLRPGGRPHARPGDQGPGGDAVAVLVGRPVHRSVHRPVLPTVDPRGDVCGPDRPDPPAAPGGVVAGAGPAGAGRGRGFGEPLLPRDQERGHADGGAAGALPRGQRGVVDRGHGVRTGGRRHRWPADRRGLAAPADLAGGGVYRGERGRGGGSRPPAWRAPRPGRDRPRAPVQRPRRARRSSSVAGKFERDVCGVLDVGHAGPPWLRHPGGAGGGPGTVRHRGQRVLGRARRRRRRRVCGGPGGAGGGPLSVWAAILAAVGLAGTAMTATKIASDTIIMRSIPDHYRGPAFAVYDIGYNGAFVVAALVATALRPFLSDLGIILLAGVLYLIVGGALALRRRRLPPDVEVRTYAGARADEEPREVLLDGVPVEVAETERAWSERRGVESLRCFRLRLADGRRIQVSLGEMWRLDRELASDPSADRR